MSGKKFDQGKPRFDLVDDDFEEALALVLTMGAAKYGSNNWQKVDHLQDRYYSALRRHLKAYRSGEKVDSESGLSHLAHVACNTMFLFWDEKRKTDENKDIQRRKSNDIKKDNAPKSASTDGFKINHVQANSLEQGCEPEDSGICSICGTYLSSGACTDRFCSRGSVKKLPSTDHKA